MDHTYRCQIWGRAGGIKCHDGVNAVIGVAISASDVKGFGLQALDFAGE